MDREDEFSFYQNESGETVKKSHSHKALVFVNGQILLARNEHTGELAIPGGRNKVGEVPEEAVTRELLEETGLMGIEVEVVGKVYEHQTAPFKSPIKQQWQDITHSFYRCNIVVTDLEAYEVSVAGRQLLYNVEEIIPGLRDYEAEALNAYLRASQE